MDKSPAPAITNAIAILKVLGEESPRWLGVSEIARLTGLSKASAHRFLLAMWASNVVMRHPHDVTYALGTRLIELGAKAAGQEPIREVIRDAVAELAKETGASTEALQMMPDGQLVCVAACAGPGQVSLIRAIGSAIPVLPTISHIQQAWKPAGGQVAWASGIGPSEYFEEDLRLIRQKGYSWGMTAGENNQKNLVDIAAWLEEGSALGITRGSPLGRRAQVEEISRYTEVRNTHTPHSSMLPVLGVAAPVFDANGEVPFRLLIVSLLAQVKPGQLDTLGSLVLAKAQKISDAIGGQKPIASDAKISDPVSTPSR
jgi:DNA-binding IclR family transcriptional regulator